MIEVIKKGVPYEERFFTITCKRCKSDLKFKGDEVTEAIDFEYIVCPVCDQWISTDKAKDA
jgi:hypothetical protein